MQITIKQEDKLIISILAADDFTQRVAKLLLEKELCEVTDVEPIKIAIRSVSTDFPEPSSDISIRYVYGHNMNESISLKDVAEAISKEFDVPLYTIQKDTEFLVTDEEAAIPNQSF